MKLRWHRPRPNTYMSEPFALVIEKTWDDRWTVDSPIGNRTGTYDRLREAKARCERDADAIVSNRERD